MEPKYTKTVFLMEIITVIFALISLAPFYFLIVNALKPIREIFIDPSSFPKSFYINNFIESFKLLNFPKAFMNSFIITAASNIALVIVSSMAAYQMVRNNTRFNRFLFLVFISAMVIPFQSIMIPMVKMASKLKLINSFYGVVVVYLGFGVSFTMFLFHGFIKSIPFDIEEAAVIDGCTPLGVFWRIVFPLLKPVVVTVIILNGLWIWNDFLLPFLIIPAEEMRTIPLAINSFFSQYAKKWDMAMAGLLMAVTPVIVLFLSLQRYVIEGIVSGSVKG